MEETELYGGACVRRTDYDVRVAGKRVTAPRRRTAVINVAKAVFITRGRCGGVWAEHALNHKYVVAEDANAPCLQNGRTGVVCAAERRKKAKRNADGCGSDHERCLMSMSREASASARRQQRQNQRISNVR